MEELKKKPGKHLSLFSKIAGFIFFLFNFEFRVIMSHGQLPTADETWGLIQGSIFIANIFIAVDISIILTNLRGTRQ